jgi:hypothetical protein
VSKPSGQSGTLVGHVLPMANVVLLIFFVVVLTR